MIGTLYEIEKAEVNISDITPVYIFKDDDIIEQPIGIYKLYDKQENLVGFKEFAASDIQNGKLILESVVKFSGIQIETLPVKDIYGNELYDLHNELQYNEFKVDSVSFNGNVATDYFYGNDETIILDISEAAIDQIKPSDNMFLWKAEEMNGGTESIKNFTYSDTAKDILCFDDILNGDDGLLQKLLNSGSLQDHKFVANNDNMSVVFNIEDIHNPMLSISYNDASQNIILENFNVEKVMDVSNLSSREVSEFLFEIMAVY